MAAPARGIPVALINKAVTQTIEIYVLVSDNSFTKELMIIFTPHEKEAIAHITINPDINTINQP
jgi:hypothetical protein